MDVLSVAATLITLAGATSKGIAKLKELHDAGRELHALTGELIQCRVVFQEIERSALERRCRPPMSPVTTESIYMLLQVAKDKLQVLNTLVNERVLRSSSGSCEKSFARIAWTRHKSQIKGLQDELRGVRRTLSAVCEAASLSDISLVYSRLDQFATSSQDQLGRLFEHGRLIESLPERLMEFLSNNQVQNVTVPETTSPLENSVTLEPPCNDGYDATQSLRIPRHLTAGQYSPLPGPANSSFAVRIRASQYRRNSCEGFCSCNCHRLHRLNTPKSVASLLGSLFVGYSGLPSWRQACNERLCRRQSIPSIAFTYYFPQWLVARMFHVALSLTYMNGPQVTLAMPRVIAGNSDLFTFAVKGDLEGIKNLFSRGLASPYDVCESNGRTALHYSSGYNHREISQFLIHTGANSKLEDQEQATPVSLSWARIFKGLVKQPDVDAWRVMFDDEDYLESRTSPVLHKIVLNLNNADLRQQLELSTSTINDQDSEGRTALSWAAGRSDVGAVKHLLAFGADPNICSPRGQSALHCAAQNPSADCAETLQALLDKGANVNCIDYWRRSALLYAGCNQDDPKCLQYLVEAGADVNTQDCRERTPLGYAARMGKPRVAKYLLGQGADLSIPDHWGLTPFFEALQQNNKEILRCLLLRGVDYTAKTKDGMTALHLAASHGDVQTLKLLASQHLIDLELDAIDKEGSTAKDLFSQRGDADPALQEAFRSLLDTVVQTSRLQNLDGIDNDSDTDGEDDFVDALEHHATATGVDVPPGR